MHLDTTRHAEARMRQRGIKHADVLLLSNYADIEHTIASGMHALRLSRRAYADVQASGIKPKALDRLKQLVAIEAPNGRLISCAHLHGRKAAAYRGRAKRKYWLQ